MLTPNVDAAAARLTKGGASSLLPVARPPCHAVHRPNAASPRASGPRAADAAPVVVVDALPGRAAFAPTVPLLVVGALRAVVVPDVAGAAVVVSVVDGADVGGMVTWTSVVGAPAWLGRDGDATVDTAAA